MMVKPVVVCECYMRCDLERYKKTGYMGEENIKNDGPVVQQGIWRIRTNQELRDILNLES